MKKTLLVLMLLISMFLISACGNSKKNPNISNPDAIYMSATEGGFTYSIKNKDLYATLKKQVGLSTLLDIIDIDLLQNTKKDNVSYWDMAKESVVERLNDDIFPNGKEDLTKEEILDEEQKYYDQMFMNYGLTSKTDVEEYYQLIIARELYAKEQLRLAYAEEDLKDEIDKYFNANYMNGYYAIIVSFDSYLLLNNAMKQLGYDFKNNDWIKLENGTIPTVSEITQAFIDLYNMQNASKVEGYPTSTLSLNLDNEYKVVDGKYVFALNKADKLFYTHADITSYQLEIQQLLKSHMSSYLEGDNWYTKTPQNYKNGARYSLVLKIAEKVYDKEVEKANIREKLLEAKLTNAYISEAIIKLRAENNLVIFDKQLEDSYITKVKDVKFDHAATKERSNQLVAKINNFEYTADKLFHTMASSYGISAVANQLEYIRFLENMNLNDIYNFNTKEVIDATEFTIIKQAVKDEKSNFEKDVYKDKGYPASYGWTNFLQNVYGVENEEELLKFYVYQSVRERQANKLAEIKDLTEESQLWLFYKQKMEEMVSKYYNNKGVHLLISVNNSKGSPINPTEWTETQRAYAKEAYLAIMNYLKEENNDSYSQKLIAIDNAFKKAPLFLAGRPQTTEAQPEVEGVKYVFNNIEVSKYKSVGLTFTYQDLGTFQNGSMVVEFDEAAKSIWNANSNSKEPVVYGIDQVADENYQYLSTMFGYHIYVNLETMPITEWETGKVIPTLSDIQLYAESNDVPKDKAKVKVAINTYFSPIKEELKSTRNLSVQTYRSMKELTYDFKFQDFSKDDFVKYLDLTIQKNESGLKYK